MLTSQKINNDPEPYRCIAPEECGGGCGISVAQWQRNEGWRKDYEFAPRPEFANDPNPLLEAFRGYCIEADRPSVTWAAGVWAGMIEHGTLAWSFVPAACALYRSILASQAEREHALKVLFRLGALGARHED